ncbi:MULTISPECIES: hypothetical protein [Streptomyces]|uniref:Amino acid ABC transporter permease n=1 Tax=Streptomyces nymphaeiformis TaxID=2663842 RepID=A0A7W7XCD8_9ACTN|nr:hypothetical protein [Streptomyces nymphaeiformis]MBB4982291.1 hypothetical protein [Streptomyces nymphaeiformis]
MALNAKWQEIIGEQPAAMSLAGLPAPEGGGGGDLKADVGPWHSAGNTAGELRTSTSNSVTDLDTANEGVTGSTAGFDSSAALTEILGTWKTRVSAVRDECGRLEGALKAAGRDFGEREEDTRQKVAAEGARQSGPSDQPGQKKEG